MLHQCMGCAPGYQALRQPGADHDGVPVLRLDGWVGHGCKMGRASCRVHELHRLFLKRGAGAKQKFAMFYQVVTHESETHRNMEAVQAE